VTNDAASQNFADIASRVPQEMRDASVMQQQRAVLTATATAANGTIQVTVEAQRGVTKVVVDESYLDEFEFADVAGYVTTAAQAAAREVQRQDATLIAQPGPASLHANDGDTCPTTTVKR
jgi:DNA-binding protein YbaB